METPSARRRVDADLVYATGAACAELPPLPADADLAALLLPAARLQGRAQLAKASASASGAGCALYLGVDGAAVGDADAFAAAAALDAKMGELASDKALRGGLGLAGPLALKRATIRVDDKTYALALDATPSATSTVLTLGQSNGACAELQTATNVLGQLLPEAVHAGEVQVSAPPGSDGMDLAKCVVQLDVMAQTEATLANTDAFQLLKAMDSKLDAFVDASAAQLQSANVQLAVIQPTSVSEAQSLASTSATGGNVYNPPSAQMATSIFVGFMMLTAMLLGVVFTKKQHEKRCRERYERANRAAQIHRVTLRMTQHEEDANDDEEDSLL